MRPRPSEVAKGIRRVLAEVVAPDLQSEYAQLRVRDIRVVLAQVNWDEIGLSYLRETRELSRIVDGVSRWATGDGKRSGFPGVVAGEPPAGLPTEAVPTFEQLDHHRVMLDEWVTPILPHLVTWVDEHPDDLEGASLLQQLSEIYLNSR